MSTLIALAIIGAAVLALVLGVTAGSYQAQLHLLYKRLREIVAEEGRS